MHLLTAFSVYKVAQMGPIWVSYGFANYTLRKNSSLNKKKLSE